MNACTIVALLGFFAAAGLLIQNLSLKKKHAGYKTIQEAIRQESTKLTVLQEEQRTAQDLAAKYAASAREEEANVAAAVNQRSKDQAAIEKLKAIIADLDKSAERARSELATARNQGASVKAELEVHHEHRNDLAAAIANLNKEKLTIAARVTHLLSLEARESTLRAELEGLETNIRNAQSKSQNACDELNAQLVDTERKVERAKKQLNSLIGQIDLYSRVDDYTRVGHFEMPNYLYDTSVRYQSEIKEVRERQRKLIVKSC
jgi:chromosome segregation ATPase